MHRRESGLVSLFVFARAQGETHLRRARGGDAHLQARTTRSVFAPRGLPQLVVATYPWGGLAKKETQASLLDQEPLVDQRPLGQIRLPQNLPNDAHQMMHEERAQYAQPRVPEPDVRDREREDFVHQELVIVT